MLYCGASNSARLGESTARGLASSLDMLFRSVPAVYEPLVVSTHHSLTRCGVYLDFADLPKRAQFIIYTKLELYIETIVQLFMIRPLHNGSVQAQRQKRHYR